MPKPNSIPALAAPPPPRDNPLTRSVAGVIGLAFLSLMVLACVGSLPYTLSTAPPTARQQETGVGGGSVRYNAGSPKQARLPPFWWYPDAEAVPTLERRSATDPEAAATVATLRDDIRRYNSLVDPELVEEIALRHGVAPDDALQATGGSILADLRRHWPRFWMGTDHLGRSLLIRCLTGGGISLGIGIAAALLSVFIGTLYGAMSAYAGGKIDAVMMRIVDILYGLPYILLVVLLAVAVDAFVDDWMASRVPVIAAQRQHYVEQALAQAGEAARSDPQVRERLESEALDRFGTGELGAGALNAVNVVTLLVAIGGVSWLTMARVIRGQVLSLKSQPFMEAARALGIPWTRQFTRHLLPNLLGPIIVYATLTVPQAILQESFLSFLGIGVKPPLPSWGNLAADGLGELNTYKSRWWLLVFPCVLLGTTLLALNFVGEGLREAFDPKRARR